MTKVIGDKLPSGMRVWHDHYAFRTFGVPGLGISSLAAPLKQLGYEQQGDTFEFPVKKLQATWFAPKDKALYEKGLPRIFVSEIEVDKLSPQSQAIIHHYTSPLGSLTPAQALGTVMTGILPWIRPTLEDYQILLAESEYAAWTLAHGYALNHTAISIHRLSQSDSLGVVEFTKMVEEAGIALNKEGGIIKVSPDHLLLQSSTVSDKVSYHFSGGGVQEISGSYIEFAERKPLAKNNLPEAELTEVDRRDGFEVGNADKIFMSTNLKT